MLRITPEHGTFRVARQVTFDARRRFPRTAGGLGCSATISGLGGVFIAGSDIDQPSCWAEKPRSGSGEAFRLRCPATSQVLGVISSSSRTSGRGPKAVDLIGAWKIHAWEFRSHVNRPDKPTGPTEQTPTRLGCGLRG